MIIVDPNSGNGEVVFYEILNIQKPKKMDLLKILAECKNEIFEAIDLERGGSNAKPWYYCRRVIDAEKAEELIKMAHETGYESGYETSEMSKSISNTMD